MMSPEYIKEMVEDCEDVDFITEEEEIVAKERAILVWLWTFPQVSSAVDKSAMKTRWATDDSAGRAILHAAAEICGRDVAEMAGIGYWNQISEWVGCNSDATPTTILSALLCFAIDEECSQRNSYIGRIMGLDKNVQRTLMQLIKDFNDQKMELNESRYEPHPDESYLDEINIDEDNESLLDEDGPDLGIDIDDDASYLDEMRIDENNESLLDDDDRFDKENRNTTKNKMNVSITVPTEVGVPRTPLSPRFQSPRHSHNVMQGKAQGQFSRSNLTTPKKLTPLPQHPGSTTRNVSARKVIKLEKETSTLKEKNQELLGEIESIRQQENSMRVRCEETEAIHRAARLKLESEALMRESEVRDEFTKQIRVLERKLGKSQKAAKEASVVKEQLASLQDEVDIMKDTKIKLAQSENKLQKLKSKLLKMSDVGKALKTEEEAHSDALSKCLKLENELAALVPLKRQLEEYKARATEAEVKLVDCEDEIKKMTDDSTQINNLNDELQRCTLRHQEEVDAMRRTMEQNGTDSPSGQAVGEGISELNPALKEELLRLRNENERLKKFAAKREDDSVQRLEEKADDSNRLADRFKEQYLTTKSKLETSQRDLVTSLKREQLLEKKVADLEEESKLVTEELQNERVASQRAKLDATRTLRACKKDLCEQAEVEKAKIVQEWTSKCNDQRIKVEEKHVALERESKDKEDELNSIITQLRDQSVKSLQKIEKEFSEKTDAMEKSSNEEIQRLAQKNEEERSTLIVHGKQLMQKNKDEADSRIKSLEEENDGLKDRHHKFIIAQKDFEKKVEAKRQQYKQKIALAEARAEETAKECDELQTNGKKMEREKGNLQSENDRLRRQLGGRFGTDKGQYEELQRNYNDLLVENRALKEKNADTTPTSDLASSFNFDPSTRPYTTGASVSASSLSQLRAEYEEKIGEINDEKRELVMKNSALVTDGQKAQKRAWELEVEVKKLENMNTSLQLQVERTKQNDHNFTSPPIANSKRSLSSLTPTNAAPSKASRMWKSAKKKAGTRTPSNDSKKGTPDSTEPHLDLKSPEFQRSVKKLKGGDVESFKKKLMRRLSSKKKKGSPIKSMSLMDMAASNKRLEF